MVKNFKPRKKTSRIWTILTEDLANLVRESENLAQVLKKLNFGPTGGTHAVLKERLKVENIDYSHMKMGQYANVGRKFNYNMTLDEAMRFVFVQDSKASQKTVRRYIRIYNLLPYFCQDCRGEAIWNCHILVLQLDHIDGDNRNHMLSNLRWLCPNCHSQTATYGAKNHK